MRRAVLLSVVLLLVWPSVVPAGPGSFDDWDVLVPRLSIVDAVAWNGRLAGAEDGGGLLIYDPSTDAFETIGSVDGLLSHRVQALAVDGSGRLWMGTADAGLARLDAAGSLRSVTGLQDQMNVRAIAADGDLIYFGGPAGAGRLVDGFSEQTFTEGNGLADDDVRDVVVRGTAAWFATAGGVSRFDRIGNVVETLNGGLGSLDVRSVEVVAGEVVVGTADGIYVLDDSVPGAERFQPIVPAYVGAVDQLVVSPSGSLAAFTSPARVSVLAAGASEWFDIVIPAGQLEARGVVYDDQGELWVHGAALDPTKIFLDRRAAFYRPGVGAVTADRGLFGTNARGLALDGSGGVWVGCFPVYDGITHWRADGSVVAYALRETGVGDGWLTGLKNAVEVSRDGAVWVSTFGAGITRMRPAATDDPASATYEHFTPANSPLGSERVRRIEEDPLGRLWILSSGEQPEGDLNVGIDILLDPSAPALSSSWQKVTPDNSQLAGGSLWDVHFESGTVVWIAMEGAVQRWDFSGGLGNTADASAVWTTILSLPQSASGIVLEKPRTVTAGPDGRVWVGTEGSGIFGFPFDPSVTVVSDVLTRIRVSNFDVSLLSDKVRALSVDAKGDVWAATEAGLNRYRDRGGERAIDSWTNFVGFENFDLADGFSPDILSPLPASNLVAMVRDSDRNEIYTTALGGVARFRVSAIDGVASEGLDFSVHPNPIRNGDDRILLEGFEGEVDVEVYNLLGVLLHTARGVRAGDEVWDTQTLAGEFVASGMYVLRVAQGDRTTLRTLAVER